MYENAALWVFLTAHLKSHPKTSRDLNQNVKRRKLKTILERSLL